MAKALTKQQKFDLEFVYKPMLEKTKKYSTITKDPKHLLAQLCCSLSIVFEDKKYELMNFLENYEDRISNWYELVTSGCPFTNNTMDLVEFVDLYKDHLGKKTWEYFSWNGVATRNVDFLRKYGDKLNWEMISEYKNFTIDELREFKDKIKWSILLRRNYSITTSSVVNYLKKCLDLVDEKGNIRNEQINQTTKI